MELVIAIGVALGVPLALWGAVTGSFSVGDAWTRRKVLRAARAVARRGAEAPRPGERLSTVGRALPLVPMKTPFGDMPCVLYRVIVRTLGRILLVATSRDEFLLRTRSGALRVDPIGAVLRWAPERADGTASNAADRIPRGLAALKRPDLASIPGLRFEEFWIPPGAAVYAEGLVVERDPVAAPGSGYRAAAVGSVISTTVIASGYWELGAAEPDEAGTRTPSATT
ncbi:MAG: hypothetical protein HYY06_26060 [Deltaproteobacteria bacterium]|nr:hypothetical protein [Deltaproteobacteria bacterium]